MSIQTTQHTQDFSSAPQISVDDVAEIARLGFKTIINNRPDGEGGALQPSSAQIEMAAKHHGLAYIFLPVLPNQIESEHVNAYDAAYTSAIKPVLGFCGTGYRAGVIFKRAQTEATNNSSSTASKGLLGWIKNKL